MYLIQMMLADWFGHELSDAIVQGALGYHIRVPSISGADALVLD
jgi:hypothetical protein